MLIWPNLLFYEWFELVIITMYGLFSPILKMVTDLNIKGPCRQKWFIVFLLHSYLIQKSFIMLVFECVCGGGKKPSHTISLQTSFDPLMQCGYVQITSISCLNMEEMCIVTYGNVGGWYKSESWANFVVTILSMVGLIYVK